MKLLFTMFVTIVSVASVADAASRDSLLFSETTVVTARAEDTKHPADWQRLHGRVGAISGDRMVFHDDSGARWDVDLAGVPERQRAGLNPGEMVTLAGVRGSGDQFTARAINQDDRKQAGDPGGWQRLHGTVGAVSGDRMVFHEDGGKRWDVDLSRVPERQRAGLNPGEAVMLAGLRGSGDQFAARAIQQDDRKQPGDPGGWQRLHGTIGAISADRMVFHEDSGKRWEVDLSKVPQRQRAGLNAGETVTVAGLRGSGDQFSAGAILQDDRRQGPAASPRTDDRRLPNEKEDCRQGGWQRYGDRFKSQDQCVDWVERRK